MEQDTARTSAVEAALATLAGAIEAGDWERAGQVAEALTHAVAEASARGERLAPDTVARAQELQAHCLRLTERALGELQDVMGALGSSGRARTAYGR